MDNYHNNLNYSNADIYFMQQAIALAKKGQFSTRPNPAVGCVIVKDGVIIGKGFHDKAGRPHAEIYALNDAKKNADTKGATAYVTLEPCSHYGRTPPCAKALIEHGITRVVIACKDPNPKVDGGGINMLKQAGVHVCVGVCQNDAQAINVGFFWAMTHKRAYVRLKTACSLDGKIALKNRQSKWISSEASRKDVQYLRAKSGAIITGAQTVLADLPKLNVRLDEEVVQPMLVVMDRQNRLADLPQLASWWAWQNTQPRKVLLSSLPLEALLTMLFKEYQIFDVLVEAGSVLSSAFLAQNLVDEWVVYQAMCLLGDDAKSLYAQNIASITEQKRFYIQSATQIAQDMKLVLKPY